MAGVTRVLVVDDHPLMRAGIRDSLAADASLTLAGEAESVDAALRRMAELAPDVVVCDLMFPDARGNDVTDGLRLVRALTERDGPPVLLFSAYDREWFYRDAFAAGAAGYLVKSADGSRLAEAVHQVASGGTWWNQAATRAVRRGPHAPTARERTIIALLAQGATNAQIAAAVGISGKTVEAHLGHLFARYGVQTRAELAVLAVGAGWIPSGEPGP